MGQATSNARNKMISLRKYKSGNAKEEDGLSPLKDVQAAPLGELEGEGKKRASSKLFTYQKGLPRLPIPEINVSLSPSLF